MSQPMPGPSSNLSQAILLVKYCRWGVWISRNIFLSFFFLISHLLVTSEEWNIYPGFDYLAILHLTEGSFSTNLPNPHLNGIKYSFFPRLCFSSEGFEWGGKVSIPIIKPEKLQTTLCFGCLSEVPELPWFPSASNMEAQQLWRKAGHLIEYISFEKLI